VKRVLILGGTGEAVAFANDFGRRAGIGAVYSLAGRTRTPAVPDCDVRRGGFGGAEGLVRYVANTQIAAIVDMTHPYAARMAANARAASEATGVPLFKYLRPAWEEPPDAPWRHAETASDAARIVGERGFGRVFLSGGLNDVDAFSSLTEVWFLVRGIDPPETAPALASHHFLAARGPFGIAAEKALMQAWRVDALVSKNSGGGATVAKLHAARDLAIPIVMIDRPRQADHAVYTDISLLTVAMENFLR